MRAATLPGGRRVELVERPVPVPGMGQVLVAVKASAICGSDVRAIYREHVDEGGVRYVDGTIGGH